MFLKRTGPLRLSGGDPSGSNRAIIQKPMKINATQYSDSKKVSILIAANILATQGMVTKLT